MISFTSSLSAQPRPNPQTIRCYSPLLSFRAVTLINSNSSSLASADPNKLEIQKLFRKYYGKRVTKLTNKEQTARPCPPNRFKAVKSFEGDRIRKCPSKAIEKLDIRSMNSKLPNQTSLDLVKSISHYKHLRDLSVTLSIFGNPIHEVAFLKQIGKLTHLESLGIFMKENRVITNARALLSFDKLKTMKITVLKTSLVGGNKIEPRVIELYLKPLQSKTLQYLHLDLLNANQDTYTNSLIQALNQTSLPSFHLLLKADSIRKVSSEDFKNALDKVDYFTVRHDQGRVIEFSCSTKKASNVSENQNKRRLTLELRVPQNLSTGLSTSEIQEADPPRSINELLLISFRVFGQVIQDINNISTLKSLTLNMRGIHSLDEVKNLTSIIRHAGSLEHLKLSRIALAPNLIPEDDVLQPFFTEISKLANLESLEITESLTQELLSATYPLSFLKNLKKLRIEFGNFPLLFFPLEFPESSKLTELSISIPFIVTTESGISLMNNIAKLKDLQKLTISNGSQLFTQKETKNAFRRMLGSLLSLKEVSIGNDGGPNLSASQDLPTEMKEFTVMLIQKNPNLQKVQFDKLNVFEIKYQR